MAVRTLRTTRHDLRTALTAVPAAVVLVSLIAVGGAPAAGKSGGGPDIMTQTSWYGISLGDSMTRAADDHGWSTGSCVGASVPDYINVPRHFRVEVARGAVAGKVGRIVSWGKVQGPHGVRHGVKVSRIAKFLKRGVKHPVMPGTEWGWTYWVIPMKSHFFVVRTGTDSGSGSPHRVQVFGLAKSRAVARDIGSTQGGCI